MVIGHGAKLEARFGKPGVTRGYDGVHFRTAAGRKAYTNSLISILQKAEVGWVEEDCPEWEVARGRRVARSRQQHDSRNSVPTHNRYSTLN